MQAFVFVAALALAWGASARAGEGRSSDPHEQQLPQPLLDSSNLPELPLGNPDTVGCPRVSVKTWSVWSHDITRSILLLKRIWSSMN